MITDKSNIAQISMNKARELKVPLLNPKLSPTT